MKTETLLALTGILLFGFIGLRMITESVVTGNAFSTGRRNLERQAKWQRQRADIWTLFPIKQIHRLIVKIVYIDSEAAERLESELSRAQLSITPRDYVARRWVILLFGGILALLCYAMRFYFGILLAGLLCVFCLMREREAVQSKIKKREQAIAREMPRFVHTIARTLQGNRDIENAVEMYRRVSGPEMSSELDILLTEMRTGNVQVAILHFGKRLGTTDAFRLCSILQDLSTGVDQTAALQYLAGDLSRQAKESIRKELLLRPAKMRRTYYPAVLICVIMILYVLVMYVIQSLNSIW
jgi:Flp pilus assembly protein TadB